jgi:hypothetical protein
MKRIFEHISAICILGLLSTGVVSCETGKTTPLDSVPFSVLVNFGDGEEVWRAKSAYWVDYRSKYNEVNFHFEAESQFPAIAGIVMPAGETLFPESWSDNRYLFFEYFSQNWVNVASLLLDKEYNILYGDWQVDSGTVSITSINATHLSGKADLVMYDLVEYAIELNDNPRTKHLTVVFTDIPLNEAMQNDIVRGAVESPIRSMSFSGMKR